MSFLELVGLDALLSGDGKDFFGSFFKAAGIFLGIYIVLAIINQILIDKVAAVSDLVIGIIMIIVIFIIYIKKIKSGKKEIEQSKKNELKEEIQNKEYTKAKIFLIVSLILYIASFIAGLFIPFHCLVFDYEYKGVFSALAMPLYPVTITYLIYSLTLEKGIKAKFERCLGLIGKFVLFFLSSVIISLSIFILVLLFKGEDFIDKNILMYNNYNYDFQRRINWKVSNYEQYFLEKLPEEAKSYINNVYEDNIANYKTVKDSGDMKQAEKIFKEEIKYFSFTFDVEYGLETQHFVLNDYDYYIRIRDKTYKEEDKDISYYYKLNFQTYETKIIDKEEFLNAKKEYQKTEEE